MKFKSHNVFSLYFCKILNFDSYTEFGMDHISLDCKFLLHQFTHLRMTQIQISKMEHRNINIRSLFLFCRAVLIHQFGRIKLGVLLSTVILRFKIGHPIKSQDLWLFCEFMLMSSWIFILNAFAIYCARAHAYFKVIMIHPIEIVIL